MRLRQSEAGRAASILLAAWAITATAAAAVLYLDREVPAPHTPPDPAVSEEVLELRERVRTLETERPAPIPPPTPGPKPVLAGEPDSEPSLMPPEDEVRALLAAYRRAVETGAVPVDSAAAKTLAKISIMAEHDPRAHLPLIALLEIATGEEEMEDLLDAIPMSWEGGPRDPAVTEKVLAGARLMLASEDPARRVTGGELLLGYAKPSRADFLLARDAVLAETDAAARSHLLGELAGRGWEVPLEPEERASVVDLLSRAVREGRVELTNSLAHWSDLREDFDLAVGMLEREREPGRRQSLLTALRAGVRLTKGREDEAEEILVRVMSDPAEDPKVRGYARNLLDSHKPWDDRTAEAVDRYRDEVRDR